MSTNIDGFKVQINKKQYLYGAKEAHRFVAFTYTSGEMLYDYHEMKFRVP